MILSIAELAGLNTVPVKGVMQIVWICSIAFQCINEEIICRAVLINWVGRHIKNPHFIAVSMATFFAILHFVFYRFVLERVSLSPKTLTTIFLFGLSANYLYLKTRNVALSTALHIGWNLNKFGNTWMFENRYIGEAESFNIFEGHSITITAAMICVLVCFSYYIKNVWLFQQNRSH